MAARGMRHAVPIFLPLSSPDSRIASTSVSATPRLFAASAGLIDAAGYVLGAIIAGELAGHLVQAHGFGPLWWVLFAVSAVTLIVAIVYWIAEERRRRLPLPATPAG